MVPVLGSGVLGQPAAASEAAISSSLLRRLVRRLRGRLLVALAVGEQREDLEILESAESLDLGDGNLLTSDWRWLRLAANCSLTGEELGA